MTRSRSPPGKRTTYWLNTCRRRGSSRGRTTRPPAFAPSLQMRQFDVQDRRLQRVDAEVPADVAVVVLRTHAVHAVVDEEVVQGVILDRDRAGVAERAEVLRWEEGEAGDRAENAGAHAVELGADRLGRVLDDRDAVPLGGGVDLVHRRPLSV